MISEAVYKEYLASLLQGNSQECGAIVKGLLEQKVSLLDVYENLFQRSLYRIGKLWEMNEISVAREHLATAITENLFSLTYPEILRARRTTNPNKVIISCSPNEHHQIGGRMISDIFELAGWNGLFLGANTPEDNLVELIEKEKPDMVGLSLSLYLNMEKLRHTVEKIKANFPSQSIIIGGQAFLVGGSELFKRYSATEYIPSIQKVKELYLPDNG